MSSYIEEKLFVAASALLLSSTYSFRFLRN